MQTTRLTLICHARTVAQKLARFPTNEPVENIRPASDALASRFSSARRLICGPELRTRQTAAWFGADAQVDEVLRDCDWGRWHGQSIKDLQLKQEQALYAWLQDPHATPHGGESVAHLCERVAAWLVSLQTTPGHVVAVTHPFIIRAALIQMMRGSAFHYIDVEPLSVVELRFTERWRLRLPSLDDGGAI
ncbi:histidine phosphatase family protein [Pseudomonas baetica]|uniref:histidine phosphatase family protein n=1 Tax=Pseudomonas TaxID=286 RepID=UPI001C8C4144|nr:histidine phosphatase family protein [Pseudomonas baetica]MBX9409881.1 histidine phosphatase family protein [Pseudomonas baetica]